MLACNRSDDSRTQPVVLMRVAALAVATEKAIKQPWCVRRFDGRTAIRHRQPHFADSQGIYLDADGRVSVRVARCIGDQDAGYTEHRDHWKSTKARAEVIAGMLNESPEQRRARMETQHGG